MLTAYHCEATFADGMEVYVGAYENGSRAYNAEKVAVERSAGHPKYRYSGFVPPMYDFRVVKLAKPSRKHETVRMNSDTDADPVPNDRLTVVGMGDLNEIGGHKPKYLQELTLDCLSYDLCVSLYNKQWVHPKSMICAGGNFQGPCYGDRCVLRVRVGLRVRFCFVLWIRS